MNPWSLAAFFFIFSVSLASAQETKPRPNIILIMADDLGWSDIGCYGGEIGTPHIDSLARDGMRFTQFYNNAICGPTRASLLTGLFCQQTGHRGDRWNEPKNFDVCMTIGEVLQQAGYHTMMVGKWQGRDSALDRGFDRFYGPMCQAKISYYHEVVQNPFYLDRQRIELPEDYYLTDAFNAHADRFLKESLQNRQPFLLYVAHIAPHWPLHAHEGEIAPFRKRYETQGWDQIRAKRFQSQRHTELIPEQWQLAPRAASIGNWDKERHKRWQAERMAVYAAQVKSIDRGLGQLLQTLKAANAEENTLVIFLSDNGAAPDGGLNPNKSGFGFSKNTPNPGWRRDGVLIKPGSGPDHLPGPSDTFAAYGLAWATTSNTPFRGTKLEGYEGGIRTPLVVRWPSVIQQGGAITRQPGHVIDFMATFLDIAQAEYPSEFKGRHPLPVEGVSLLPVFRGKQRTAPARLCWDLPRHQAIREGNWKAIRLRQKPDRWQLYDLERDGTETTDVADQHPELVKGMAHRFDVWYDRVNQN
ncbi:arylsulfatase [Gimesia maris]|uniref:Arylsulfatase n=1 Tax=Gimesia maris TaxID=122 RepID=A0ABX5YPI3_9PLAN|nr:arylsulfatase [Gimesia maris]EDL60794.1 arylsulfatase (aryl-sulfate sulphohydrolase) [Gimesia maris DSM 8797]QEG17620.1 Arylsulfatase [Gimesia maris]QGQ29325.1 arylsulfatase [Gimesia maris]